MNTMEEKKNPELQNDDDIDLGHYFYLFAREWLWIALFLLLSLITAYVYNKISEKIYNSTSTILIKDEKDVGTANLEKILPGGDLFGSRQNLENEIAILSSYSLNYLVARSMPELQVQYVPVLKRGIHGQRLYKNSPFIIIPADGAHQPCDTTLTVKITPSKTYIIRYDGITRELRSGEKFSDGGFSFIIKDRSVKMKDELKSVSYYEVSFQSPEDIANSYRRKISVAPVKKEASVLTLSVNTYSPNLGADYLNKLMELYISQGLDLKNQTAEKTIAFIDSQVGIISDSLNAAESRLEDFRRNNRLVDLSFESSLVLDRLERFETDKNTLDLQQKYYDYLLKYLDRKEENDVIVSPAVMGVNDPSLLKLVEEFSVLQQETRQMAFQMNSDMPAVKALNEQIEGAREALRENVLNAISQLKISMRTVEDNIAGVEREISNLPGTQRKLVGIQRRYDLNSSVYNFLLERRSDAAIAKASRVSDNRVIDPAIARYSTKVSPNTPKIFIIAFMLGLLVPLILIVIVDLLNDKIVSKNEIDRITKMPVIGHIGHSSYDISIPVRSKPASTLAEGFRSIRTSLPFFTGNVPCPVIVITSSMSGEGKSFVSANLACITSMLGRRVLLVGLDMRKPSMHKLLGVEVDKEHGMSHFLSNAAEYKDVIMPSGIENLWFAPTGTIPPNPAELIGSDRLKEFFTRARKDFDYIFIDTPPAGIVTDAKLLAGIADVMMVVARQHFTTRRALAFMDSIYRSDEIKNMGLIINDITTPDSGFSVYGSYFGVGKNYYNSRYYYRHRNKDGEYYVNE